MRKWINLIESVLYADVEAASLKLFGHAISGGEADAFYGTANPKRLTQIIEADIMKLFASGSAKLCRILNVPDRVVEELQPGMSLGPLNPFTPASWTHKWEDIEPNALHIDMATDSYDEQCHLIVVEAEIPFKAVNMELTIAQNIELHWESEVTLNRDYAIKLLSIHRAESYGVLKEELRPDLRGARMLT